MRNRYYFLIDIALLLLCVVVSYLLRLDTIDVNVILPGAVLFATLSILFVPLVFYITGVYSRYWRYASVGELMLLGGSVTVAVAFAGALTLVLTRVLFDDTTFPRSIPIIFLLLALVATPGPRLLERMSTGDWLARKKQNGAINIKPSNVLIIGAGDAGAILVRELKSNPQLHLRAVGFIDDDLIKHDALIHGVPVLGGRNDIADVVAKHKIDQVIIAMPTVPGKEIGKLARICEQAGLHPKIMPGLYELIDGKVSVSQLRNVDIEDLLRREPVQTDVTAVQGLLCGKRVLVTGGGGSIGSELCRQILRCEPAQLVIVGHGENSIFEIEAELNQYKRWLNLSKCEVVSAIADIRFEQRITDIFSQYRPQVVFHAAAHKHVPLMEANPAEAITNNVLGTRNILDAAENCGVERFVMISTDKAVRPTSVMGASKRVAELLVNQTAGRTGKPYVAVRFGNVLGSRGSVVPTFRKQIAAGGPVTVTHPEMTRFFMTIPEAVQLVLQAAVLGHGGEVFLLDMGEPVKIVELAKSVIELSGLEVGKDIEIQFTGTRPGEKLYEELFLPDEVYQRTRHEKIFIVANASTRHPESLDLAVSDLAYASSRNDPQAIREGLQRLIPEYCVTNAQAS